LSFFESYFTERKATEKSASQEHEKNKSLAFQQKKGPPTPPKAGGGGNFNLKLATQGQYSPIARNEREGWRPCAWSSRNLIQGGREKYMIRERACP